jgi:drug/metabolite transporter (DMT)-like permease
MAFGHAGELAALGTAACFTITALAFESAGRRVGSLPVNLIRLVGALVLVAILQQVRHGVPYPVRAPSAAWWWLSASGLVGFTFGDLCLFRAFVVIGSRLALLLMALVPPLTSVLSYLATGETLGARDLIGMALSLSGISWVVLERRDLGASTRARPPLGGILLGLGGALGQSMGLVLSKRGLAFCAPFPANEIRMTAGILGFATVISLSRRWGSVASALRDRPALKRMLVGALFGPFLGVSLSLFALRDTRAGVAATLMALTPVLILPAVMWRRRERVSARAAIGALLAVAGTAVLFA